MAGVFDLFPLARLVNSSIARVLIRGAHAHEGDEDWSHVQNGEVFVQREHVVFRIARIWPHRRNILAPRWPFRSRKGFARDEPYTEDDIREGSDEFPRAERLVLVLSGRSSWWVDHRAGSRIYRALFSEIGLGAPGCRFGERTIPFVILVTCLTGWERTTVVYVSVTIAVTVKLIVTLAVTVKDTYILLLPLNFMLHRGKSLLAGEI